MKNVFSHSAAALVGAAVAFLLGYPAAGGKIGTAKQAKPAAEIVSADRGRESPKQTQAKSEPGQPPAAALDRQRIQTTLRNRWSIKRRKDFQRILDGVGGFDSAKTVYDIFLAEQADGRTYPDLFQALMEKAGSVAGKEFMELLRPSDLNATPPKSLDFVMRGWASTNPAEAATWLNESDGFFKQFLALSLVRGMGEADPIAAMKQFDAMIPPAQTASFSAIVEQKAQDGGLKGVADWYASFGSTIAKGGYPANITASMKRDLFDAVAERMALAPVEVAAPWFASEFRQPDAPDLSRGVSKELAGFVNHWANSDIDALGAWVSSMRGTGSYDALALQFAEKAATLDPESSRAWAATIENPMLSSKAEKQIKFLQETARVGTRNSSTVPRPK